MAGRSVGFSVGFTTMAECGTCKKAPCICGDHKKVDPTKMVVDDQKTLADLRKGDSDDTTNLKSVKECITRVVKEAAPSANRQLWDKVRRAGASTGPEAPPRPTNWNQGFDYPWRIGGNGSEAPYLENGQWKLYVWNAKENKHYVYNYSSDMYETP